jgi:hypothetical protein
LPAHARFGPPSHSFFLPSHTISSRGLTQIPLVIPEDFSCGLKQVAVSHNFLLWSPTGSSCGPPQVPLAVPHRFLLWSHSDSPRGLTQLSHLKYGIRHSLLLPTPHKFCLQSQSLLRGLSCDKTRVAIREAAHISLAISLRLLRGSHRFRLQVERILCTRAPRRPHLPLIP